MFLTEQEYELIELMRTLSKDDQKDILLEVEKRLNKKEDDDK